MLTSVPGARVPSLPVGSQWGRLGPKDFRGISVDELVGTPAMVSRLPHIPPWVLLKDSPTKFL